MKDAVLIKSYQSGITLLMREDASLEEILQELAVKFTEAKNFFGTSTMALSMEGREVTEVEEIRILDTIRKNSNVRIACIVGHDETTNKNFIKALQHMEKKLSTGDEGQFYKGPMVLALAGDSTMTKFDFATVYLQGFIFTRTTFVRNVLQGSSPGPAP